MSCVINNIKKSQALYAIQRIWPSCDFFAAILWYEEYSYMKMKNENIIIKYAH